MEGPPGSWVLLLCSCKPKTGRIGTERFCHLCYSCTEICLLSNNIRDYYFVSQGKTEIAGLSDGEELMITDVSCRLSGTVRRVTVARFSSTSVFLLAVSILIMVYMLLSVTAEVTCNCFCLMLMFLYTVQGIHNRLLMLLYIAEVTQPFTAAAYTLVHRRSDTALCCASLYSCRR
jgi:hypothetical protein